MSAPWFGSSGASSSSYEGVSLHFLQSVATGLAIAYHISIILIFRKFFIIQFPKYINVTIFVSTGTFKERIDKPESNPYPG
jgi:hypothetical protein